MTFSLHFEENAERRQRLRLAQQSRELRARDADISGLTKTAAHSHERHLGIATKLAA
jgi:hypothetical protein